MSGNDSDIVAVVLGENIQKDSNTKPGDRIFSSLLMHFAQENHIRATESEIKAFVSNTEAQEKKLATEQQAELTRISRELEDAAGSQAYRDKLLSQKATLERALKMQKEIDDSMKGMEDEMKEMKRSMAESFVVKWKVNKALYDKYGGRVIFQQAGPEPLDAYRDFLKEELQKGSFQIFDPKVEEDFWRYFTNDKMHTFFSEKEAKEVMHSPWWMTSKNTTE